MTKISCEKCGKEFNSKSHYTQHQKRKTPCVNESKIKELIDKSVEEKIHKLTTSISSTSSSSSSSSSTSTAIETQPPLISIETSTFDEIKKYYDEILNIDKSTYKSSNDEPTPIDCISEMISKIPNSLWETPDLSILDPCCGNGNFSIPILFELLKYHDKQTILEKMLEFNDINEDRLDNVRKVFCSDKYNLQITNHDFITFNNLKKYDLIVANPPYAKLLENGKRASKNHNLIKDFIEKALSQLKPNGYLLFITPDNWMSFADRNLLIEIITSLQIIHLDIHTAKKYFKKIGSSFTWYIIQNCAFYKNINVSGIWKKKEYISSVVSKERKYIPLLYNQIVQNILSKTIDNKNLKKFEIKTSSDLHKYTKAEFIRDEKDDIYKYKLIHTPSQTVYSSRPHKFQEGYKVFISTTDKYKLFIDECGMTQSIVFILCCNEEEAKKTVQILEHPLYVFINNICRWGNFNNIRILQNFPIPNIEYSGNHEEIYNYFNITEDEIEYICANM
jgi:adenine-specific DNA-methyltransferase